MNNITSKFFKCIEENNQDDDSQLQVLWIMSEIAQQNHMDELTLDLTATFVENNRSFSLLAYTVHCNNFNAFIFLINKNLEIDYGNPTPLQCAVKHHLLDFVHLLLEKKVKVNLGNFTPLQIAVKNNFEELSSLLIKNGADVNKGDFTPLQIAASYNYYVLANLLIDNEANVNLGEESPLYLAIKNNNKALVSYLIDQGANVNQLSKRVTPEVISIVTQKAWKSNKHSYPEKREDRDVEITQWITPLFLAIENLRIAKDNTLKEVILDIIKVLLLNHADPLQKNQLPEYSFKLPEKYVSYKTPTDLLKNFPYHLVYEGKNYADSVKNMFACLLYLQEAKSAYIQQLSVVSVNKLTLAYQTDVEFFLDYLTYKIRQLNLNSYQDEIIDLSYILKFINIFKFIAINTGIVIDKDSYTYFQENTLLELAGYDPENSKQPTKLFATLDEKIGYLKESAKGASWENTLITMSGTGNIDNITNHTNTNLVSNNNSFFVNPDRNASNILQQVNEEEKAMSDTEDKAVFTHKNNRL